MKKPSNVRITQRGNRFQAAISLWHGKPYIFSFPTHEAAEQWRTLAIAAMIQGKNPPEPTDEVGEPTTKRRSGKTVRDLYDFVADKDYSGGREGDDKALIAMRMACLAIGWDTRVATLNHERIEEALSKQAAERGNAVGTVNHRRGYLNRMCEHAVSLGWLDREPKLTKVRGRRNNRWFRITPRLEEAMLQWAVAHTGEHGFDFYDFLVASIYVGQRANETLRIRIGRTMAAPRDGWAEPDAIVFPRGSSDNKSAKVRGVPAREIVAEVLNRRRAAMQNDPTGRIFQRLQGTRMKRPGAPLTARQWKKWLDTTFAAMKSDLLDHPEVVSQRREGLPVGKDFCIHIMRSEFVSRLADEGYDASEIMRYSGHKTISVVEGYIVNESKVAWRQAERRAGRLADGLPPAPVPSFAPTQPLRVVKAAPTTMIATPVALAPTGLTVDPAMAVAAISALVDTGQAAMIPMVIQADAGAWIAALAAGSRPDLIRLVVSVPKAQNS